MAINLGLRTFCRASVALEWPAGVKIENGVGALFVTSTESGWHSELMRFAWNFWRDSLYLREIRSGYVSQPGLYASA